MLGEGGGRLWIWSSQAWDRCDAWHRVWVAHGARCFPKCHFGLGNLFGIHWDPLCGKALVMVLVLGMAS